MSHVSVGDLEHLATAALVGQGLDAEAAKRIAAEFVTAEVAGVKTHGVGKLISMNLGRHGATPRWHDSGPLSVVDGDGGNGFQLMYEVASRLCVTVREFGIGLASVRNFSRYSSLYPYTDTLARVGFVGILANSAGPPAVAPYGSADPLTGTNPLCFSFPTPSGPQTFDLATSERVWGEIRQAALDRRPLPLGPFYDAAGEVTTVPTEVNAVKAFGGPKGWALNLALEILCGLMTGGQAGAAVESEFDCGALLIGIDAARTGARDTFSRDVANLFDAVRTSRPVPGSDRVRCPGDRGRSSLTLTEFAAQQLEVSRDILTLLKRMAEGEALSELSSNPLFN